MALSAGQRADHDVDPAVGLHRDVGAFARIAAGRFQVAAEPDAAQPLAFACFATPPLKAFPIAELHRALHHNAIGAVVVGDALRVLVGKGRGWNEIAPPQCDAVEPVLNGGFVDQTLDDVDDFRPAGTAVRNRRRRVREHGARAYVRRWNAIAGGHQPDTFDQRDVGPRVGADIAEIGRAQSEKMATGVEREFGGDREIAAHIIAQKRLVTLRSPFNGTPDAPGGPGNQREFGKEAIARAEVTADLASDYADGFRRNAEDAREFALLTHDPA